MLTNNNTILRIIFYTVNRNIFRWGFYVSPGPDSLRSWSIPPPPFFGVSEYLFNMRIIITENKLVNMVNNTLGYDLSDTIDMVTDYWEADVLIRRMFENKTTFTELLNNWGPMFWISTPDNGRWLAQQREGRKWFIFKGGWARRWGIDEHQLLSYMGLGMFGVPLDTIIDNFVKEK